jgi:hypothetical protein
MKPSEILYKAAERMKEGFSPHYREGSCGCFMHRTRVVLPVDADGDTDGDNINARMHALQTLAGVVGLQGAAHFSSVVGLYTRGWTGPECTADAVAALTIAADIAASEGN